MSEGLWDAGKVAVLLGVTKKTVLEWASRGDIPSIRLGRKIRRFIPEEVREWLRSRSVAR